MRRHVGLDRRRADGVEAPPRIRSHNIGGHCWIQPAVRGVVELPTCKDVQHAAGDVNSRSQRGRLTVPSDKASLSPSAVPAWWW